MCDACLIGNMLRTLINIQSEYIPTNGTAMVWDTYITNLQLCKNCNTKDIYIKCNACMELYDMLKHIDCHYMTVT